jgi:diacylglycerol O-acyltransferase / wax synthase
VPGTPVPVWVGGAAVTMQYAFGPTIGAGVNITLITYQDTCALGINADTGAVPDLPVFRECLVEGFEEVLALRHEPGAVTAPAKPRRKRAARIPTPTA